MRLVPLLLLLTLHVPAVAAQVPSDDARWDDRFGAAGVIGQVTNLLVDPSDGRDVFVAGRFHIAGTEVVANLARWDGETSSWDALEGGLSPRYVEHFEIRSLARTDGALWVAGTFRAWTGAYDAVDHLARFDLTTRTWSEPLAGLDANGGGVVTVTDGAFLYLGTPNGLLRYEVATGALTDLAPGLGVSALALGEGSLYAGGAFTDVEGVAAQRIARYDLAAGTWHALGDGVDQAPTALEAHAGTLTVGGVFEAGGQSVAGLARWDGTAWSDIAGGISWNGATPSVTDLATGPDGRLYVTGQFTSAGGAATYNAAWFDGSAWHGMPLGSRGGGELSAVAVTPDEAVLLGGDSIQSTGTPAVGLARWSPATETWSPLLDGEALGVARGSVRSLASAPDGSLFGVSGSWLGQTFLSDEASQVVRWTGGGWERLGDLSPFLPTGQVGNDHYGLSINAMLYAPDGSLYAAGQTQHSYVPSWSNVWHHANYPILLRWRGGAWQRLDTVDWELSGSLYGGSGALEALALDGTTLYVGGSFLGLLDSNGQPIPNTGGVLAYDTEAGTWATVGGGFDFDDQAHLVTALAVNPTTGDLFAGGYFESAGGNSVRSIARYDGTRWHGIRGGGVTHIDETSGYVAVLTVAEDALFVGGWFERAGGTVLRSIGRLDLASEAWSALGEGVANVRSYGMVEAVAVRGEQVFVGGIFQQAGGESARNVAAWDGSTWGSLGRGVREAADPYGVSGSVSSLAVLDDHLLVGGSFDLAGEQPSLGVARYDLGPPPTPTATTPETPGGSRILSVGPNPTAGRVTIRYASAEAGALQVDLLDPLGRRLADVAVPSQGAGGGVVALDVTVLGLPPGLYMIRLTAASWSETARLTVLR